MVRKAAPVKAEAQPAEIKARRRSTTKVEVEAPVLFNPLADIDDEIDLIEKSYALTGSSLGSDEDRQHTGLLELDCILGKGIKAGWYTFFGPEQSCKSTGASTWMTAALNSNVPIIQYWDYEGSQSPEYLENIMEVAGITMPIEEVFGIRDPKTQKWAIKPRVRYYSEGVGERFFDSLARLERILPDKLKMNSIWYYVYDGTKANRAIVGDKFDKNYWRKTGKFRVEAGNGNLQALIILDSYPAMLPEKQDVDDPGSAMAVQARMFSDQIKRVKGKLKAKCIAVVGVNQLRKAPMVSYGSPEYEPGGEALKFYCFSGDTMLTTGQGMLTGEEYYNIGASPILGVKGLEAPTVFNQMGYSQLIELCTEHGNTLKGKPGHRVLCIQNSGFSPKWKKLSAFTGTVDYYVPMKIGADVWATESPTFDFEYSSVYSNETVEIDLPEQSSVDLAHFIGYVTSEGCLSEPGRIIFTIADREVMEDYIECVSSTFGMDVEHLWTKVKDTDGTLACDFYSMKLYSFLRHIGMGLRSRDKCVPRCIRTGTKEEVLAFLSSFYEGDGSMTEKGVACFSTSNKLASEIQQLLFNLGVFAKLKLGHNSYHAQKHLNEIWSVECYGGNAKKMTQLLTFISDRKFGKQVKFERGEHENNEMLCGDILPPMYPNCRAKKFNDKLDELFKGGLKYFRLSKFDVEGLDDLRTWANMLRTKHERTKNLAFVDTLVKFITTTRTEQLVWIKVDSMRRDVCESMTYDANMPSTNSIVTSGIVSHNSDVRLRMQPRVMNAAPGITAKGAILEEKSVTGGTDTYRFIHVRAHKNKLSVPNLEGWLRLWITDSKGEARGFDPVYDTWRYLVNTGQCGGKMNALKLQIHGHECRKTVTWLQFKKLIIGTRAMMKEVYAELGMKPFHMRKFCLDQLHVKDGVDRYFKAKQEGVKAKQETAEVSTGADED